ncbi:hypothetical protein CC1G_15040 [Coprinopsis cinerea okayama7|uniref:Uncharacterized protein n=1 Tax=Coprinopsis cinerea (strain Okayama-7 / 130 / ATCC MYA-4618 / FGSC 9003) TaxID=240176 RepID=D6RP28_COPC7|nr:hypothetical protein CC1G_15040 [Coprinopsis cinerea okayama7\|eukprot:XP_002910709.1 hypothetical protein CC1G_15040 [Coprinopsis cinerea okayama7\
MDVASWMGTSAVFLTLSGHEGSPAIDVFENIFFFATIGIFGLNTLTLTIQAILYPKQALRTLVNPAKSVFVPLFVLSFANIIIGVIHYWHLDGTSAYILLWIYVGLAVLICLPLLVVWFNQPHDLYQFTPASAFLANLSNAYNVLDVMDYNESRSIGVLLVGYFFQGLGFFMTFFYICIYILRIFLVGGALIVCGPPGFTALAIIQLGDRARSILPAHNLITVNSGEIWYAGSVMGGLMLFGLAVFLFVFGAFPFWFKTNKRLHDILGCWALTFPNVGWILTLRVLGNLFDIDGFKILHLVCCFILAVVWLILFVLTCVAFYKGFIFNSEDEDVIKDSFYSLREKRRKRRRYSHMAAQTVTPMRTPGGTPPTTPGDTPSSTPRTTPPATPLATTPRATSPSTPPPPIPPPQTIPSEDIV